MAAADELAAATASGIIDAWVVNDEQEQGYQQLKAAISSFRPDIIPLQEGSEAAGAEGDAGSGGEPQQGTLKALCCQPPTALVLCGPSGASPRAAAVLR